MDIDVINSLKLMGMGMGAIFFCNNNYICSSKFNVKIKQ